MRPRFQQTHPIHVCGAACRRWYLVFDNIKNSRSENLDLNRRITGLDKLVESENDPRDYSFTTFFIGHQSLPVELSAFNRSTHSSVGRKVTTESDYDLNDVAV